MSRNPAAALVLGRVNTVLVIAGLNDTVWSIRDCDSTLFHLVWKKLFLRSPERVPQPGRQPMNRCSDHRFNQSHRDEGHNQQRGRSKSQVAEGSGGRRRPPISIASESELVAKGQGRTLSQNGHGSV